MAQRLIVNYLNNITMKKMMIIGLAVLLSCPGAFAQQKQLAGPNYELAEQFTSKKVDKMVFSIKAKPQWFAGSDRFWYEWKTSYGKQYYIVDAATGIKMPVFDMEKLAMQLTEIIRDPYDAQHIPFSEFKLKDDNTFTFEIKSTLPKEKKNDGKDKNGEKKVFRFEYDINSGKLKDVSDVEKEEKFPGWANISPDSSRVIYARNHNLYWMSMDDLRKLTKDEKDSTVVNHRLTSDATNSIAYGGGASRDVKDTTARTSASGLWSPDSKHFITLRSDMTGVKEIFVINSLSQPRPTINSFRYRMPGEPGTKESLWIFNLENGSGRDIDLTAYKDQEISYIKRPAKNSDAFKKWVPAVWVGDNSKYYVKRTSRDLKRVDICEVSVADGKVKPIIEERLNTYLDTQPPRFVNNGKEIIWWSERNGWGNLYLYASDGTLKNAITEGAFHVSEILSVDERARVVFFLACGVNKDENPYNGHIYRIGFDGKGMKQLDNGEHNCNYTSFSDDSKYFVSNFSRVNSIPQVALFDGNGKETPLETADFSLLFAAGYKFPEPFKVKAAEA